MGAPCQGECTTLVSLLWGSGGVVGVLRTGIPPLGGVPQCPNGVPEFPGVKNSGKLVEGVPLRAGRPRRWGNLPRASMRFLECDELEFTWNPSWGAELWVLGTGSQYPTMQ